MAAPPRIGFLGAGMMAEALAKGFVKAGVASAGGIVATDIAQARKDVFAAAGMGVVDSSREAGTEKSAVQLLVQRRCLKGGARDVRRKQAWVARVHRRSLGRSAEQPGRVGEDAGIQRPLECDVDVQSALLTTPSAAALLPQRCDGAGKPQADDHVKASYIHAELERIGCSNATQLAAEQATLQVAPSLR
jgi:hypothetical protein